jgi:hypothetical protein
MTNLSYLCVLAFMLLGTPALAQLETVEKNVPAKSAITTPPTAGAAKAPEKTGLDTLAPRDGEKQPATTATTATATASTCKKVIVARPDVSPALNEISVRFRSDLRSDDDRVSQAILDCLNGKPGTTLSSTRDANGGVKVKFATRNGEGEIALPTLLSVGVADQVVCNRTGEKISHKKYATAWSGGLGDKISLAEMDTYDKTTADRGCATAQ